MGNPTDRESRPPDDGVRLAAALERIATARRAVAQESATRHGLSVLQVEIVRHLAAADHPVRSTDLAAEFAVTLATVSDAVTTLRRKLVVESRRGEDARTKLLTLSADGRRLAERIDEDLTPFRRAIAAAGPHGLVAALAIIGGLWREGVLDVDRSCATCLHHRTSGSSAGRCDLLGQELDARSLRVDCAEHAA